MSEMWQATRASIHKLTVIWAQRGGGRLERRLVDKLKVGVPDELWTEVLKFCCGSKYGWGTGENSEHRARAGGCGPKAACAYLLGKPEERLVKVVHAFRRHLVVLQIFFSVVRDLSGTDLTFPYTIDLRAERVRGRARMVGQRVTLLPQRTMGMCLPTAGEVTREMSPYLKYK